MHKFIITIFYHDPKTKEITHKERLRTKFMDEDTFEKVLKKRLSAAKKSGKPFTYAVGGWID